MGDVAATDRMTAEEYLEWERRQPGKHEFHRGEVFAMAGGSPRHNFLSNALGAELRAGLRGRECHVLSSDQRISAARGERYVYADVVVVCGDVQTDPKGADILANPAVLVEVLSPGTETYDRGAKWDAYQRLPSLTDYLMVAQDGARIEHYRREADGSWRYRLHEAGSHIELASGVKLSVDAVYAGAFDLPAA